MTDRGVVETVGHVDRTGADGARGQRPGQRRLRPRRERPDLFVSYPDPLDTVGAPDCVGERVERVTHDAEHLADALTDDCHRSTHANLVLVAGERTKSCSRRRVPRRAARDRCSGGGDVRFLDPAFYLMAKSLQRDRVAKRQEGSDDEAGEQ